MTRKKIKSKPGLFGLVYHYDESGKCVGKSRPGLVGNTRVYTDQNGNYTGKSRPGLFADEVYTDTEHNYITSVKGIAGKLHYKNSRVIGITKPGFFDSAYTEIEENADEIHTEDEEEYAFVEENPQKTVIRNVIIFGLCVGVCVVIFCIYAIKQLV